jgi:uncharacterized protein YhdP
MNVVNADKLSKWIDSNKDRLSIGQRGTLQELANHAQTDLKFKVSSSSMAALMKHKGIPTGRVSKAEAERMSILAENERVRAENKKLKRVIAAVAASECLDPTLKTIVFEGLDEEMRAAIFPDLPVLV